ncbi:arginine repressor [Chlamydia abortus]|nr:arginine repressor [Chlamydia abortus]SGA24912.1 arginine repressor [Chlamydia abortus]SGW30725.1 arginine repressor [Chlamydia abortus]
MKKTMAVDEALKEILNREGASTQEEICQKLSSLGIAMTQSSVSRWLRKVHTIKIPGRKVHVTLFHRL